MINLKNYLCRILLASSSFSGVLLFLYIGNKIDIPNISGSFLNNYNDIPKYIVAVIAVFLGSLAIFEFVKWILHSEGLEELKVKTIRPMESNFLPVYIGLFVVALELDNTLSIESGILIFVLFVFWIYLENVAYFNPFLLIFGYRFYEVTSEDDSISVIITKKPDIKQITNFESLMRITNFNFIEK